MQFSRRFATAPKLAVIVWLIATPLVSSAEFTGPLMLSERLHHLRIDGPREWSEFPETPEGPRLELKFVARKNAAEQTLSLRQQDVKQPWLVQLNGRELGRLVIDENDMVLYFAVPAGALADGENTLRIEQEPRSKQPDDVRVGGISLLPRSRADALAEARIEIEVVDVGSGEVLPARITVLNADGALQTVAAVSNDHLAVRPGIVYTAAGKAQFGVPAGRYTVHAGRGFEYSLDTAMFEAPAGQTIRRTLKIRREVPTAGYVACDTHVHTLTFSGHGDATAAERMITLAAEGIELPIATDHNRHVDHEPLARQMQLRQHFTPVVGNEFTTSVGHFNVFPARPEVAAPDWKSIDWRTLFAGVFATPDVKVAILNHARDLHAGVRPFGPKLQNAAAGANLEGWQLRANAMEVVNSGSVQTDVMQLFHDWMTQLNHGQMLAPVGGSDSHDVGRHFVGQGRTYVRARDTDPGDISVDEAVNSFLQGRVMVSYGLLAELTVNDRFGPGELVPATDEKVEARVRVLGPHWVEARKVLLFANGQLIREAEIPPKMTESPSEPGVLWTGGWTLDRPRHDVHLVAIATGPGVNGLYWKTAKPYQPTSPDWTASVLGASGAVWLDVDGDGRRTPAIDYARPLVAAHQEDLPALLAVLADYDAAVGIQAAHLWQGSGNSWTSANSQAALQAAAPQVQRGIREFLEAARDNEIARLQSASP